MTATALPAGAAPDPAARLARRQRDMRKWRRRSRLIAAMRIALPLAIAIIAAVFAGWVIFGSATGRIGAHPNPPPGTIHMSNARFLGRDEQGRAYVITAADAARDNGDMNRITLDHPALVMDSESAHPTHLTADSGVYREDNRILMLDGHVSLKDSQGGAFTTNQAIVDTVKGAVAGRSAVDGAGPTGAIHADSYAVYDRGDRLVFQGKVHSRINTH